MAIRHPLWTDQEVDVLVQAYAKTHKQNQSGRFFTSKDWSRILDKVNKYNIQNFNRKDMKQIKNKIDTLIKTHKREQGKQKNNCGVPSNWIYFHTMEEIQLIKDENHHLYPTHACDKIKSCDSNPSSLLKINQNYSRRNDEETYDIYESRDEQFSESSYDARDPYSVLDLGKSDGQDDHKGLDTLMKESGEPQQLCKTKSQLNLKVYEPFKLSPDSDEFIEEVERMFAEPTGDIAILCSLFPHV